MKSSLFAAAFAAISLPAAAQLNVGRPARATGCVTGQQIVPYDLRAATYTNIVVKPGDRLTITDEKNTGALYGPFIHLTNGAFGPRDGCATPTCMRYAQFPEHPMGVMMLMLIDNQEQIVDATPIGDVMGQEITVGPAGGRVVFATNEFPEYRSDNQGRGTITLRLACGK